MNKIKGIIITSMYKELLRNFILSKNKRTQNTKTKKYQRKRLTTFLAKVQKAINTPDLFVD